jgi:hypothetical protein
MMLNKYILEQQESNQFLAKKIIWILFFGNSIIKSAGKALGAKVSLDGT